MQYYAVYRKDGLVGCCEAVSLSDAQWQTNKDDILDPSPIDKREAQAIWDKIKRELQIRNNQEIK